MIDEDVPKGLADDVALPGLEDQLAPRRWVKTQIGYLAYLARLDFGDRWRFWSLADLAPDLFEHRGPYARDEVGEYFAGCDDDQRPAQGCLVSTKRSATSGCSSLPGGAQ